MKTRFSKFILNNELPETEERLFQLNFSLFDLSASIKILGDKESVIELLPISIDSIKKSRAELQNAHKNNDWDRIRRIAHRVKGGSLAIGTIKMGYACQYIEKYCLAGYHDCNVLEKLYKQLIQVLDETQKILWEHLLSEKK